jgi:hypothetical protein
MSLHSVGMPKSQAFWMLGAGWVEETLVIWLKTTFEKSVSPAS